MLFNNESFHRSSDTSLEGNRMDEKRRLAGIRNWVRSPDDRGGSRMDTYVSGPLFLTLGLGLGSLFWIRVQESL